MGPEVTNYQPRKDYPLKEKNKDFSHKKSIKIPPRITIWR